MHTSHYITQPASAPHSPTRVASPQESGHWTSEATTASATGAPARSAAPLPIKSWLKTKLKALISDGEWRALSNLRIELRISRLHRQGLKTLRSNGWSRPERLNLGSGSDRKPGFLNVDLFPGGDLTLDLRRGLPFASNATSLIVSEHFFEHVDYPGPVTRLLQECFRVLRPGGRFRMSVPDTAWPVEAYVAGADHPYFTACKQERWHPDYCQTRAEHLNYHYHQDGEHKFLYDEETARLLLDRIGFIRVARCGYDAQLDSPGRKIGSLVMEGFKPGAS
jgi:predicted SAM-dependent methyltransferase